MKKSRVLWIIIFLLAIAAGYMRYYPITNDSIEVRHIVQEELVCGNLNLGHAAH